MSSVGALLVLMAIVIVTFNALFASVYGDDGLIGSTRQPENFYDESASGYQASRAWNFTL